MKNLILSIVAITTLSLSALAQAPEGFKYQAVVRDAGNNILTNQAVGMRMTIQQGSIGGTIVYTETFTPTTNAYGLVNLEIGNGTVVSGTFASIDWANGPYYIETAVDITGGTNYSVMGTSQLMSVPYALYAKTSGNGQGPAGPQGIQGLAGVDGTNGIDGVDGVTGPQGATGLTGPTGPTGLTGPQGPIGLTGATGATGSQGPIGLTGAAGATGPQGIQGLPGTNGAVGATGATGSQGLTGLTGPAGTNGATGATGAQGIQGATGLTGAVGSTGPQGIQGLPGTNGAVGATGLTGVAGTNGKNTLVKTTSELAGVNCSTGGVKIEYGLDANTNGTLDVGEVNATLTKYVCNGAVGTAGATGLTGLAGTNGATGPTGLTGPAGANGAVGATGSTGTAGTNGATGATGPQGAAGPIGLTGAAGTNGAIGATGATGPQGIQGLPGSNGAVGATGATGPQGATGPAGSGLTNGTVTNQILYWNGSAWVTLNPGSTGQTLSVVGGALTWVTPPVVYPVGSVFCASGPTLVFDVTNPTTGRIWMDRNLGATQVATSSTDAASYGDLYQWGRRSDGHQCRTSATTATLSSIDQPANGNFILASTTPNNWRSPQNNMLWQGVNGINNPCPTGYRIPETELTSEMSTWSSQNSIGAFASNLKLTLTGARGAGAGGIAAAGVQGYIASSTISGGMTRQMLYENGSAAILSGRQATGYAVRCIKEMDGSIGALNCDNLTVTGNLFSGVAASNISASVPYTGGNGCSYATQSVSSTGVTGLTATISQGLFTSGSGNLTYAITGTSSASGTATFALNIGGKSCNLNISIAVNPYPLGSVFCASGPALVFDVTNPTTGKTWMDRNLGATQVATSTTDAASYGDLYQWGRRSDGHQCRNSGRTYTISSSDQPGHDDFIAMDSTQGGNWRSSSNDNLWQGVNGINNPCPSGYRLPTASELDVERLSWSINTNIGAFNSPLKLPVAGVRDYGNGYIFYGVGEEGAYWSSTFNSYSSSDRLFFNSNYSILSFDIVAHGFTVRCIKD